MPTTSTASRPPWPRPIGVLREAGVGGPYAIALGPGPYTGLTETAYGGYPVLNHVRLLLEGPVVWAPAVDCAVVLSVRGGDFELIVRAGPLDRLRRPRRRRPCGCTLEESLTFRALTPEAAVVIVGAAARPEVGVGGRHARQR